MYYVEEVSPLVLAYLSSVSKMLIRRIMIGHLGHAVACAFKVVDTLICQSRQLFKRLSSCTAKWSRVCDICNCSLLLCIKECPLALGQLRYTVSCSIVQP